MPRWLETVMFLLVFGPVIVWAILVVQAEFLTRGIARPFRDKPHR